MLPSPQSRAESDGLFRPVEPAKSSPFEAEDVRNGKDVTPGALDAFLVKPIAEAEKKSRRSTSVGSYSQAASSQPEGGVLGALQDALPKEGESDTAQRNGKVRVARALFDSKVAADNADADDELPPPDSLGEASLLDTSAASLVSLESAETIDATVLNVAIPAQQEGGLKSPPQKEAFDERKLFIGQIPRSFGEIELTEVLAAFGPLSFISILRNNGRSRCCAFATFVNVEDQEKAIEALHMKRTLPGLEMAMQVKQADKPKEKLKATVAKAKARGKGKCKTKAAGGAKPQIKGDGTETTAPAASETALESGTPKQRAQKSFRKNPYHNVYVTMISRNTTKEDLEMMFARHGSIIQIAMQVDSCQRRCGLLSFENRADAAAAVSALDRTVKFPDCPTSMVVYFAGSQEERLFGSRRPERAMSSEAGGPRMDRRRSSPSSTRGFERRRSGSSSSVGSGKSADRPRRSGSSSSSSSKEENAYSRNRARSPSNGGGGNGRKQNRMDVHNSRDHMMHSPFPGGSPMVVSYHPFSYKNTAPPSPAPDVFGVPTMSVPMHRSMSPATYMYHTQPPPMSPPPPMVGSWFGGYEDSIPPPGNYGMMSPQVDYSYQYVPEMMHENPVPATPPPAAAAAIDLTEVMPPPELPSAEAAADAGELVENSQPAEEFVGPPSDNDSRNTLTI